MRVTAEQFPAVGIGRFQAGDEAPFAALVVDGQAHALALVADADTVALFDDWQQIWPQLRRQIADIRAGRGGTGTPVGELRTLAPIRPRQIMCAGANYRRHVIDIMADHDAGSDAGMTATERRAWATRLMDHRAAAGAPFGFIKPISSLAGAFDPLLLPPDMQQPDWELELAVVLGRPARRVARADALQYVAGYTIANDISARDHIARRDIPSMGLDFLTGKAGPGFLPLGPVIVPAELVAAPQDLQITLSLNGQVMQDESTADMIFPIARLIEFFSTHMQLLPGDVICTGSPAGNGTHYGRFLRAGDVMLGAIHGLGAQKVECAAEVLAAGAVQHRPFVPLDDPAA